MAEKARPIKADRLLNRYSGYRHNRTVTEDPELTHVGPGTPCGEYLRRFWQPIEFSAEVNDLPKRIKILDEELVLFRDRSGHVGLLDWRCSHRGMARLEQRQVRVPGGGLPELRAVDVGREDHADCHGPRRTHETSALPHGD